MAHDPREWICVGRRAFRGRDLPRIAARSADFLSRVTPRVTKDVWVRYRIDLGSDADGPDADVRLTPITDAIAAQLRAHPDFADPSLQSALTWWFSATRGGLAWFDDDNPLCVQWLLTADDAPALRTLPVWANMYPPLAPGTGQVEKLWTFSTARQKGVATRFARLMFAEARRRGLRTLFTHIHRDNVAANTWARKTGWEAFGTIERYEVQLPVLRSLVGSVCIHRCASLAPVPAAAAQRSGAYSA